MKKSFLFFYALTVFFVFSSCNGSKPVSSTTTGGSEQFYQHQWNLIELNGQQITTGNEKAPHLLFSPGQVNKVSGSTGCNRLNGSMELTGVNFIKFSPLATTRMACPGNTTEAPFIEALGQVNNWSIVNNQLLLSNGKILLAKFNAAETSKLSGNWELNYISGRRIAFEGLYPGKKPQLTFIPGKTDEVDGHTSCNSFSSKLTVDGNKINITAPTAMTKMACEGEGETAFLDMLKKVNKYDISEGNSLVFLTDDIVVMRFSRK